MRGTDHGAGAAEQENPPRTRGLRRFGLDQGGRHHAGQTGPTGRGLLQHMVQIKPQARAKRGPFRRCHDLPLMPIAIQQADGACVAARGGVPQ